MKRAKPPSARLPEVPSNGQSAANGSIDTATIDLLQKWRNEDATEAPEEIRAAEQELAEFKSAMNKSRAQSGESPIYP